MYAYCTRDQICMFLAIAKLLKRWWPGTESNRRRRPFQGRALPTELPGRWRIRTVQYRNPRRRVSNPESDLRWRHSDRSEIFIDSRVSPCHGPFEGAEDNWTT